MLPLLVAASPEFPAQTVEYVLFVRDAMWPDTDLAIFVYKCTFHPLLWTFVLHPVLRHLVVLTWVSPVV